MDFSDRRSSHSTTTFDYRLIFSLRSYKTVPVPCLSLLCSSIFYISCMMFSRFCSVESSTRGKILVNITKTPLFYFSLSSSLSQLPRCKELVAIHQSPVRYLGHNEYKYFRSHVHAPFPPRISRQFVCARIRVHMFMNFPSILLLFRIIGAPIISRSLIIGARTEINSILNRMIY